MLDILPVVSKEVAIPIGKSIITENDNEYCKEQLSLLKVKNPVIAHWIENFSNKCEDKIGATMCGLIVYRLLESQAEANRMKSEILLK